MDKTPRTLVLHSSPVTVVLSIATPLLMLAVGVYALTLRVWVLTVAITAIGAVLALIVLFDLPIRAEFDGDGVTRVCLLRRQRLEWSRVVALERARGRPPAKRSGGDPPPKRVRRAQGLVARLGPRRVSMLVDRRESLREYDAVSALLRKRATRMRATPPPLDATPAGRGPESLHRLAPP